jgi:FkbH-like protein
MYADAALRSVMDKQVRTILRRARPDRLLSVLSSVEQIEKVATQFEQSARVFFLRNYTVEGIEPFLKYHLYCADISPEIAFGNYDVIHQEVLDSHSCLHEKGADLIVLTLMLEGLAPDYLKPGWSNQVVADEVRQLLGNIEERTNALVAVNTFLPPFYSESGVALKIGSYGLTDQFHELNRELRQYVREHSSRFFLIDWERIVRILGEERSIDYRFWYTARAPFKQDFYNLYAKEIGKLVRALKGKAKKCVVLDCDNTLWGGIVGEDGLDGIQLSSNEYPGRVYYEFQMKILHLFERGVLVALCSKNNEDDVWEVLDQHPHCLLKREHLAAWRINWDNKASNMVALAEELNLTLDSFVMIDDSPVECDLLNQMLPDVTVIQVPEKSYLYPQIVFRDGLFDTLAFSAEDKDRTKLYRQEATRKAAKMEFDGVDDYLRSLELVANIHLATSQQVPRVAQLTQKTNQFNLTTHRFSEAKIREFMMDELMSVYCVSVSDKFGDSGLSGVLIARKQENNGIIDTLLLSCRVLGRGIERVFVNYCIRMLHQRWQVDSWKASYVPTKKNGQVSGFWDEAGFTQIEEKESETRYCLSNPPPAGCGVDWIRIVEG